MSRIIRCDRCKREMPTLSAWATVHVSPNPDWVSGKPLMVDLCERCVDALAAFFAGDPLSAPELATARP